MALSVSAETVLHVDKQNFRLYVVQSGDTVANYGVCVGVNPGQKMRKGDNRTPEGTFKITSIERSSAWKYDTGSDGEKRSVYGPWFFRLNCPQSKHIGIHGTSEPESIGSCQSEGCIRLKNEDLLDLKRYIKVGTKVIIYPN
ncbi:MAG: L,D-transpeptidase [Muribaculaceae bacterium]|nr:L,D-transpeptidase [Muribaculaceae bacterium]